VTSHNLSVENTSIQALYPQILLARARILRRDIKPNSISKALALLENATLLYPENTALLPEYAFTLLNKQLAQPNHQKMEPRLTTLLKREQHDSPYFIIPMAWQKYQQQLIRFDKFLEIAEQAIKDRASSQELILVIARLAAKGGKQQVAENYFLEAMSLNASDEATIYYLAQHYVEQERYQQATALLQSFLSSASHFSSELQELLLQIYIYQGDFIGLIDFMTTYKLNQGFGASGKSLSFLVKAYVYLNLPAKAAEVLRANRQQYFFSDFAFYCLLSRLNEVQEKVKACDINDAIELSNADMLLFARERLNKGEYQRAFAAYNALAQRQQLSLKAQVDRIYAASQSGNLSVELKLLAEQLLTQFKNLRRLGKDGYGILDAALLVSLDRKGEAVDAIQQAREQGWLHWYDWCYQGPHPAINHLLANADVGDTHRTIEDQLKLQRARLTSDSF
jgi:hypothetical protein